MSLNSRLFTFFIVIHDLLELFRALITIFLLSLLWISYSWLLTPEFMGSVQTFKDFAMSLIHLIGLLHYSRLIEVITDFWRDNINDLRDHFE